MSAHKKKKTANVPSESTDAKFTVRDSKGKPSCYLEKIEADRLGLSDKPSKDWPEG